MSNTLQFVVVIGTDKLRLDSSFPYLDDKLNNFVVGGRRRVITEPGAVATAFNELNEQRTMKAVATAPGSVIRTFA